MPKITALIHADEHSTSLGRTLDSLRPCDQVLVVVHSGGDSIINMAHEHGAKTIDGIPGVEKGTYAVDSSNDWILCLLPTEALTEELEASLFEWKELNDEDLDPLVPGFAFALRQERSGGWDTLDPVARLVDRRRINWSGELPPKLTVVSTLAGDLLRFTDPAETPATPKA